MICRILRKRKSPASGRGESGTRAADEYEKYLYENGIKVFADIAGNLGAQMMRFSKDGVTEFITISYWADRGSIKAFAGDDLEKPHHLPNDRDYLLELPKAVKNCDLIANEVN